jgi:hypothetical protein
MIFHDVAVLARLRALADRFGLLLIFDEIFTGFSRTGAGTAGGPPALERVKKSQPRPEERPPGASRRTAPGAEPVAAADVVPGAILRDGAGAPPQDEGPNFFKRSLPGTSGLFVSKTVAPNIVTLSKALTGGTLPLAATIARESVFAAFWSDAPRRSHAQPDVHGQSARVRHRQRVARPVRAGTAARPARRRPDLIVVLRGEATVLRHGYTPVDATQETYSRAIVRLYQAQHDRREPLPKLSVNGGEPNACHPKQHEPTILLGHLSCLNRVVWSRQTSAGYEAHN